MIFFDGVFYSDKCLSARALHESSYLETIMYTYIFPIQFAFGIIGNSLNLWIFVSDSLRNRANDLLAAVSLCDLIFLILMVPISLSHFESMKDMITFRYYYYYYKSELSALVNWISAAAIWLIFFVTAERYLVIKSPLRPKVYWWNRKRSTLLLAIFISTFLITSYHHFEYDCQMVYFCNGTQIRSFCYSAGFNTGNKNWDGSTNRTWEISSFRKYYIIYSTACNVLFVVLVPIIAVVVLTVLLIKNLDREEEILQHVDETCCHRLSISHHRQKRKVTITVIAIASCFAFTQGPSAVMYFWEMFIGLPEQRRFIHTLMSITTGLVITGKTTNFILFCLSSAHFRRKFVAIFFKKFPSLGQSTIGRRMTSRRASEFFPPKNELHKPKDYEFHNHSTGSGKRSSFPRTSSSGFLHRPSILRSTSVDSSKSNKSHRSNSEGSTKRVNSNLRTINKENKILLKTPLPIVVEVINENRKTDTLDKI
uniref:G_PROTEIN_RECEP_F1_2 domain-containing protein n=1 Tax=Strongyloides venezuelensis TaxID=75913 RepID=A0A0K0EXJ1_STRVS